MLDKIFDLDNPVMRFLTDLFDLLILNLITLVLCIPVVTAVPALTALHHVTLKMARDEQSYIVKTYFQSFARNFKQAFVIGLLFIAAAIIAYTDWRLIAGMQDLFPQPLRILFMAAVIVVILLLSWTIPLQAHFENPIRGTLRNSMLLSVANFPRTLLMIVIWLIPAALVFVSYAAWAVVFMFGLSAPAFVCAKIYSPVFKRFEPEQEPETADELFSMDDADLDALAKDLHETFDSEDHN